METDSPFWKIDGLQSDGHTYHMWYTPAFVWRHVFLISARTSPDEYQSFTAPLPGFERHNDKSKAWRKHRGRTVHISCDRWVVGVSDKNLWGALFAPSMTAAKFVCDCHSVDLIISYTLWCALEESCYLMLFWCLDFYLWFRSNVLFAFYKGLYLSLSKADKSFDVSCVMCQTISFLCIFSIQLSSWFPAWVFSRAKICEWFFSKLPFCEF